MYNYLDSLVRTCARNIESLYTGVHGAFCVKTYIFFDGISAPYDKNIVHIGAPSSAMPLWRYQKETNAFTEWSLDIQTAEEAMQRLGSSSLPILSMTLIDEKRTLHDLTDFLESVRVFHRNGLFPSVAHIIGAWSLSSGIVLSVKHEYYANIITSAADMLAVPVDTHEYYCDAQTQST